MKRPSEPIFNVPPVVASLLAALVIVHVFRVLILPPQLDYQFLLLFSFNPARYTALRALYDLPGGASADLWSFFSYSLLHASVLHLGVNAIWFLPFGSALARRFGALRFLAFFMVTAAAGAFAHLLTHFGEYVPMVGASAAISGIMAGAMRFAFRPDGPLIMWRPRNEAAYRVSAISLADCIHDPRIVTFTLVWFGINAIAGFGLGGMMLGQGQTVAWQAHIGGFLAGLFLFSAFDPIDSREVSNASV